MLPRMSYGIWILTRRVISMALCCILWLKPRKQTRTFKTMRSCGLPANTAIYNVMIECCKLLPCFKSAGTLVSLMLRDGYCPIVVTYTSLLKVLLAKDDFEGAPDLLDLCITEGIQPDIGIFNAILSDANARGNIHIVECILECIRRAKIQPDGSTLWYTFCTYVDQDLYNTAVEALQVLSMRMISEDASALKEKGAALEDLILNEEPDAELSIIKAFGATKECSVVARRLASVMYRVTGGFGDIRKWDAGCKIIWKETDLNI